MKKVEEFYEKAMNETDDKEMKEFINTQKEMSTKMLERLMYVNAPIGWLPFISLYINARFLMKANPNAKADELASAIDACDKVLKNVNIEWK